MEENIKSIIALDSGQKRLVEQLERLYLRMQKAGIAFAVNDDSEVVVYNAKRVKDCANSGPLRPCDTDNPDWHFADTGDMHAVFPVFDHEELYIKI